MKKTVFILTLVLSGKGLYADGLSPLMSKNPQKYIDALHVLQIIERDTPLLTLEKVKSAYGKLHDEYGPTLFGGKIQKPEKLKRLYGACNDLGGEVTAKGADCEMASLSGEVLSAWGQSVDQYNQVKHLFENGKIKTNGSGSLLWALAMDKNRATNPDYQINSQFTCNIDTARQTKSSETSFRSFFLGCEWRNMMFVSDRLSQKTPDHLLFQEGEEEKTGNWVEEKKQLLGWKTPEERLASSAIIVLLGDLFRKSGNEDKKSKIEICLKGYGMENTTPPECSEFFLEN